MKQNVLFLLIGLICIGGLSWGEEPVTTSPTVTIGSTRWYSQDIAHEDLLKIAQKENKPILTVFSAVWCGPCQQLKETALKKDEFKSVADKVILQYVEQTTPKGQAYCQRFAVRGYPTLKIFSPEGEQLEEAGQPERTPEGFSLWIDKVKSGDNIYTHRKNVKDHPDDLAARMKLARSIGHSQMEETFTHLDVILNSNNAANKYPDTHQEAMEQKGQLAGYYLSQLGYNRTKGSPSRPSLTTLPEYPALKKHMDLLLEHCVPDKFRFAMKENWLYTFTKWYATTEEYAKVVDLFEKYGREGETVNWDKYRIGVEEVLQAYGKLEQTPKLAELLAGYRDHILANGSLAGDMGTSYSYLGAQRALIDLYLEQNKREEAEKQLILLMNDFKENKINRHDLLLMHFYGNKEKLAIPYFLPMAEAALKASTSKERYAYYFYYGGLLTAAGEKDKAKKLFIGGLEDPQLVAGLPADQQALMKAQMIHGLAENELFDAEALRVGEELLQKQRTASTLSAVSKLKAGTGDAVGAVRLLEEAKTLETDAQKKADYDKRITDLKAKPEKSVQ